MSGTTGRGGVAGSSALMFSGTLVSRLLGMVRSPLLLGAAIGANLGVSDAFAVANKLPNIIYLLIAGGVLNAILVPALVRAMARDDDGGQTYANRLLTVFGVGLFAVTLALTVGSQFLVWLYAGSMSPQWFDIAVAFAWWTVPQLFFYGMYTMLGQILNARGIFGPYMWAPAVNNLVAIAGLLLYLGVYGTAGDSNAGDPAAWTAGRIALLAGTATLGIVCQALILVVPLRRSGFRYRFDLTLRGSGLGRASRTAMWVFAAVLVGQVSNILVSQAAAGARSRAADVVAAGAAGAQELLAVAGNQAYDNAYLLYSLPTSLVVVSLVTALFTRMSTNAATGRADEVRDDTSLALRVVGVFTVFVAPAMMVLALPMTRILNAAVSYTEVRSIATVLACMSVGLVAVGAWTVLQRVYYAFEATRHLFWIQLPTVAVLAAGALFAMTIDPHWTVPAIGVAMAVSNSLGVVLAYGALRRYLPDLDAGRVVRSHLRIALAAAGPVAIGWGVLHLLGTDRSMGVIGAIWRTLLVGAVMVVLYVVALKLARVPELPTILRPLGRLAAGVGRRLPGPLGRRLAAAGTAGTATGTAAGTATEVATGAASGVAGAGDVAAARDTVPATGSDAGDTIGAPELAPDGAEPPAEPKATVRPVNDDSRVRSDDADLVAGRYLVDDFLDPAPGMPGEPAEDLILHRAVRILRLDPSAPRTAGVLDAARRASLVGDERLLTVLDVGQDETVAWVVTEEIPGTGLDDLVAEGPLDIDDARTVVGEVASALEAGNLHGVHHLRLTPDHIRVTREGEVVVVGIGTHAALLGTSEGRDPADMDLIASSRDDGIALVELLHLALTGTPAPRDGALATLDYPQGTPEPVLRLAARTFVDDEPPVGPSSVVRALAPWEPLAPASDAGAPRRRAGAILAAALTRSPRRGGSRSAEAGAAVGTDRVDGDRADGDRADVASTAAAPAVTGAAAPSASEPTSKSPSESPAERATGAAEKDRAPAPVAERAEGNLVARVPADVAEVAPSDEAPHADRGPVAGAAGGNEPPARRGSVRTPAAAPLPTTQRRLALIIVGGLVLLALILATMTLLRSPGDAGPADPQETTTASPAGEADGGAAEDSPEPSPTPTAEPRIASLAPADPDERYPDHPEDLPLATDGDRATAWRSLWYDSPTYAGVKEGIGIVVELEEPALVSEITLDVAGTGGRAVVLDAPVGTPGSSALAATTLGPGTTVELTEPRVLERLVVRFTELPVATENGRNMIALHEITVE